MIRQLIHVVSGTAWWMSVCALIAASFTVRADDLNDARIRVAINVFPVFIAARSVAPPHPEHIALVFADDGPKIAGIAYALYERLQKSQPKARLSLTRLDALQVSHASDPFTAVFLAQALDDREMKRLLTFARTHHVLSFSPLAGDIERGVLGGIAVSDRILPEVNLQSLIDHGIDLRPFFLKVSAHYEAIRQQ